jgi:hypothetical protein
MSKFLRITAIMVVSIVLLGSIWYFAVPHEIASNPNWPKNIHRRLNALGMIVGA